ncbi:hypothetical protein [Nonomuraea rhizosphaerae]|uniref:hypothetical protein n=1 Tax=Nonomuraea rhizosphaerae TaxID=2665663 RepID=UPI001C5F5FAF|nr:hypothetical protein [Nonomuraea rhizosphaerae]
MTTGPSRDDILARLAGKSVTQGWDVVYALAAHKVNELFQRQFVLDLGTGSHLPPVTGSVPVIGDYAVEFDDVVLGRPLIAFDPGRDPQAALLTIPIVAGIVRIVVADAATTNVVSTQWITEGHGYTITGTVPLAKVKGEVGEQTHVILRIEDGKGFFAGLGLPDAAGTILGTYFLGFLRDHATAYRYALGTLDYTPNSTDLTPAGDFELATQRDQSDPDDAGRVLLFVPTKYHPQGGSQTALPLADPVPAGMDVALLVSSRVFFGDIVRKALYDALSRGGEGVTVTAGGYQDDAWATSSTGGRVPLRTLLKLSLGSVQSGWCGRPEPVVVPLKDIGFFVRSGRLAGTWKHDWPQPWSVELDTPLGPICEDGQVTMTVELDVSYLPSADPVTAVISFQPEGGIKVSYTTPDAGFDLLNKKEAQQGISDWIAGQVRDVLGDLLLGLEIPHVGAFAVTSLLFPGRQTSRLESAHVPGDLVAFGTLRASDLAVTPPVGSVATGGTLRLSADRPVSWSVPRGCGKIDATGLYTPPATLTSSKVVVVTATAVTNSKEQAYAAVVVSPAEVRIAPIISVLPARAQPQAFTAALPGAEGKAVWSISPAVGSVDADGVYTPPKKVGKPTAVTIGARIGDRAGQARIVVLPAMPAAVQVTPYAPAPLGPGGTLSFAATLGGDPIAAGWSLLPQVGAIDDKGGYTAPERIETPQAVLVVAADPRTPALGGTAVVLLTPDDPEDMP